MQIGAVNAQRLVNGWQVDHAHFTSSLHSKPQASSVDRANQQTQGDSVALRGLSHKS